MELAGFPGIRTELLEYLMGIAMNNHREYFVATRGEYERNVKRPLYALAEALLPAALDIDPDMEQRPSRIVSRIRRDTRFTRDKTPYRSNMWLSFHPAGRPKSECFGLYYDISPRASCYGAGFYDCSPERARWLRGKLLRQQEDFLKVLCKPAFAAHFRVLGEDYRRIEIPAELDARLHDLYRKKSFYVEHSDGLDFKIERPEYAEEIAQGLLLLKPLYKLMMTE